MLGFGNPNRIAEAQELAIEVLKILNAALATLRARVAAESANPLHFITLYTLSSTL